MAGAPPPPPSKGVVKDVPYPFGKPYSVYALVLLMVLGLLNYIDRYVVAGIGSHLIREFGMSDFVYGLIPFSFLLIYSIVAYPAARFAETRGRNKVVGIGVGIWSVATVFSGIARNIGTFFVSRGVLGIGEASYAAASSPLVADYFPSKHRAKVVSAINAIIPIGGAVGLILGLAVAESVSSAMVQCHLTGEQSTLCTLGQKTGARLVPATEAHQHQYTEAKTPEQVAADKAAALLYQADVDAGKDVELKDYLAAADEHAEEGHGPSKLEAVSAEELLNEVEVVGEWRLAFYIVGIPGLLLALFSYFLKEPPLGYFDKLERGLEATGETKRPALLPYEEEETIAKMGPFARALHKRFPKSEFLLINCLLWQIPSVRILYLNGILITGALGTLTHWLEPYLKQNLGIEGDAVFMVFGAAIGGAISGLLLGGALTDKLNLRIPNGTMWVIGIGAILGTPWILMFLKSGVDATPSNMWFYYLMVFLAMFFLTGISGPTQAACLDVVPPHLRTTLSGIYMFLIHILGDAPLPAVAGLVSDIPGVGRSNALAIISLLLIASGGVALMGLKHYAPDKQKVLDDLEKETAFFKAQGTT